MRYPATLLADFYKVSHKAQYPVGTEYVYSVWIPRSTFLPVNYAVMFGLQAFIKRWLIEYFNTEFFHRPENEVVAEYVRILQYALGIADPETDHIQALHRLGYLPILIKALPEGTRVPLKVPMFTIENTHSEFFWVTNYLETLLSAEIWQPMTSATIADQYRRLLDQYADKTGGDLDAVPFQAHDFSMRGMAGIEAAAASGGAHLLSFTGSDTIPAIAWLEEYYGANVETELVAGSIPASEHSVMCAYGPQDEAEAYRHLLQDVYPSGFVSIVSDTYSLWDVLTKTLPALKEVIMARDGRCVVRPDSGDPVRIICGDTDGKTEEERKGVIQLLWEAFGGTINSKGYKQLDPHIGAIYGDSITLERAELICDRLCHMGFASTNVVFGVGSFQYTYQTRDSLGFALKSTHVIVDGEERQIFKDPATDKMKLKKSPRGRVVVVKENDVLQMVDGLSITGQNEYYFLDRLEPVFEDGNLLRFQTLSDIRQRLQEVVP